MRPLRGLLSGAQRPRARGAGPHSQLRAPKVALADRAVREHGIRSFADLGACWNVHAGYSIGILERHHIARAYVVDQRITEETKRAAAGFPQIELRQGLFNERSFIEAFPEVDALLMFDILLHQVDLDWDDFLAEWAPKARVIVIFNQMWKAGEQTVRFIDNGPDWYREWVPYTDAERLEQWFRTLGETDRRTGRKRRDQHNFWQFGITTADLAAHMRRLSFRLDFFESHGRFHPTKTPWVEEEAFIFVREKKSP